jgi:Cu2+-exporting ATPase
VTVRCAHCGTAVEADRDDGAVFCCAGCRIASELIRDAGVAEEYYARRAEYAPRPTVEAEGWESVEVERGADGRCRARIQVDGLRCASCVWVTERVVGAVPGVERAEVSYASGRASLEWDGERTSLPELAARVAALGYRPRVVGAAAPHDRDLLVRLGVATFAAMNLMLLSAALYAGWFGGMAPRFVALFEWTSLVLATPVALWAATPFYRGAWTGLRSRVLHMDLPIALAVTVLYGHGVVSTVTGAGDPYFDSLGMLVALLLMGRVLEARGRDRASGAARALAATLPSDARRLDTEGRPETVPAELLEPGDRVLVGAGSEIPGDGRVVAGEGRVRTSVLTGEADPERVGPGDPVWAGTVVESGSLTVDVEAAGASTLVSEMAEELERATDRAPHGGTADRLAPWFTGATLAIAALTAWAWTAGSGWEAALAPTIAVLVVACPCALALARPLGAAAGLGAAARRGLFLRSGDALLRLAETDLVVLDKTGTVTHGAPDVLGARDDTLRIASALERWSVHPVAGAIIDEAIRRGIPLPDAQAVVETPGRGVTGRVDGATWRLEAGEAGEVVLSGPGPAAGTIRIGDRVRPDSADAVRTLGSLGVDVVLLTGDHPEVARRIGDEVGLAVAGARVRPDGKAEWIRARIAEGRTVLFAGDGLNDGPALAAASVGVAMGSGAAGAVLAADGVVGVPSLRPLAAGIRAARAARRTAGRSRVRSVIYNVAAVGIAAAGWVNPLVAAVLMPASSLLVVAGAMSVERRVRAADPETRGGVVEGAPAAELGRAA